jgi:predicted MFS family arabinose efflux permease
MRERLRVLRHRGFRNLWLAQSASSLGDNIVIVALALFVTDLTGNPTDVGLVLGAQVLPLVTFLLIGGVWADRLPRAKLMIATDIVRASLHGLLALLIFTGAVEVWHLVVIEVLFGAAEAFFRPAYTGLVPRTVPDAEIQQAQALSSLTFNLSTLTGPAIATALVVGVGAGWAFALDALTFAVSGLLLTRVRAGGEAPAARERNALLSDLTEGFKEVRSRSWLWVTVVVFALAIPLGYAPLFVLGPTIAEDGYNSAAMFGLVTTVSGAGALGGAVLGLRWRPRHPMRAAFLVLGAWPLTLVAFAAGAPRLVVLLLAAAMGAGFSLFTIWWDTAMAERIPPHALSRASSYEWMGSLILLPFGYLLAGPAAEATSPEAVMTAGALLTAAILTMGLIPRETRKMRRIDHGGSIAPARSDV